MGYVDQGLCVREIVLEEKQNIEFRETERGEGEYCCLMRMVMIIRIEI